MSAKQIHIFTDIVILAVSTFGLDDDEVDTVGHIAASRRAVPAPSGVAPLVELMPLAVDNGGTELDDVLTSLGLIEVVVSVTVGREGVGEGQLAGLSADVAIFFIDFLTEGDEWH